MPQRGRGGGVPAPPPSTPLYIDRVDSRLENGLYILVVTAVIPSDDLKIKAGRTLIFRCGQVETKADTKQDGIAVATLRGISPGSYDVTAVTQDGRGIAYFHIDLAPLKARAVEKLEVHPQFYWDGYRFLISVYDAMGRAIPNMLVSIFGMRGLHKIAQTDNNGLGEVVVRGGEIYPAGDLFRFIVEGHDIEDVLIELPVPTPRLRELPLPVSISGRAGENRELAHIEARALGEEGGYTFYFFAYDMHGVGVSANLIVTSGHEEWLVRVPTFGTGKLRIHFTEPTKRFYVDDSKCNLKTMHFELSGPEPRRKRVRPNYRLGLLANFRRGLRNR